MLECESLFVTTKIDSTGKEAGIAQFRQTQELYGKQTLDLAQIFSLTDLDTQWPNLKDWKAAGDARYIGVTVSQYGLYEQLEAFLQRETPDFIQVNYSITERRAEERLLPLAADMGLGVLINRPFMTISSKACPYPTGRRSSIARAGRSSRSSTSWLIPP